MYRPEVWGVSLGPAIIGRAAPSGGGDDSGAACCCRQYYTGTSRPCGMSHRHRLVSVLLLGMVAPESTQVSGRMRQ